MAQRSTKGLTMQGCNAFDHCNLWSTAVSNIYIYCLSLCPSVGRYQPNCPTTAQSRWTTCHVPPFPTSPQSMHTPPLTKARMALPHMRVLQRTQASHIEWVHYTIHFLYHRYANLYYTILLKDYSSSGCVEIPTRSLPFFWYLLIVSLLV